MSKCIKLKEDYLSEVKSLEDKYKENIKTMIAEGAEDEAVLEKIKLNIVDIFTKMFNISFNNISSDADEAEKLKKLKEEYFKFFNKIPEPWRIKMEKDKNHNMTDEYYKEKIKLEVADDMKNRFIRLYDEFSKEV